MPGVYRVRFLAKGVTLRGTPFTREYSATAAVWGGSNQPPTPPRGNDIDRWCAFLSCLLNEKAISSKLEERLKKEGFNLDAMRRCLEGACKKTANRRPPN